MICGLEKINKIENNGGLQNKGLRIPVFFGSRLNQRKDIADSELLYFISESSTMSKSLADYGEQKSCVVTTSRRLADFLCDTMVKDKGLRCQYVVACEPCGNPMSEWAVPVAIFETDAVLREKVVQDLIRYRHYSILIGCTRRLPFWGIDGQYEVIASQSYGLSDKVRKKLTMFGMKMAQEKLLKIGLKGLSTPRASRSRILFVLMLFSFYTEHVSDRLNYIDQQRFTVVVPVTKTQEKRGSMSHRNNHRPSPLMILCMHNRLSDIEQRNAYLQNIIDQSTCSETTKSVLIASTFLHLKCDKFVKYTSNLPTVCNMILLSAPAGRPSNIGLKKLRASKETDTPVKESTKPDRPYVGNPWRGIWCCLEYLDYSIGDATPLSWHSSRCAVGHEVQAAWLKNELCKVLEEKRSAVISINMFCGIVLGAFVGQKQEVIELTTQKLGITCVDSAHGYQNPDNDTWCGQVVDTKNPRFQLKKHEGKGIRKYFFFWNYLSQTNCCKPVLCIGVTTPAEYMNHIENGRKKSPLGTTVDQKTDITDSCSQMILLLHDIYDPNKVNVMHFNEMCQLSSFLNEGVNQASWPICDLANATFM
ncbi:DNA polymerase epsilon catalytic subunit [Artemisia annua]|uniref:DNA polymerase epsilon catalytic subunit n=1 Tax=Artemisia annua TaxID=35608 RepID=A0A2U1NRY5_ARTAN|nr:DNA polymerase epsilon catalytic subunit [Artemisia annua]